MKEKEIRVYDVMCGCVSVYSDFSDLL